jgi:hypothetical protein
MMGSKRFVLFLDLGMPASEKALSLAKLALEEIEIQVVERFPLESQGFTYPSDLRGTPTLYDLAFKHKYEGSACLDFMRRENEALSVVTTDDLNDVHTYVFNDVNTPSVAKSFDFVPVEDSKKKTNEVSFDVRTSNDKQKTSTTAINDENDETPAVLFQDELD